MTQAMHSLDSDSYSDEDLDLDLASDHFPAKKTELLDYVRSKEEERSHQASDGSMEPSASPPSNSPTATLNMRGDSTAARPSDRGRRVISPDKDPTSYTSHIQRTSDEFTTKEQRRTESKKLFLEIAISLHTGTIRPPVASQGNASMSDRLTRTRRSTGMITHTLA